MLDGGRLPEGAGLLSITLLGPVSAVSGGQQVQLNGRLGRTALAVLALDPGRVVSTERLVDAFWGHTPPLTARKQVHIQVSRLRRALREAGAVDVVRTEPTGYLLAVDSGCVDLVVVQRLRSQAGKARHAGDVAAAAQQLQAARAAFSGQPLGGTSEHLLAAELPSLEELRLTVVEECVAAELAAGRAEQLVGELSALVRAHPLRERLHRLRMLALYRSGRRADALLAYQQARDAVRSELGLEPSPELAELQRQILAGSDTVGPPARRITPAQLPPAPRGFVGRSAEQQRLRALLTRSSEVPRVALLSGMPGVGKTALAVEVAGAMAKAFPDGQLYVDLRGMDEPPLAPAAVLGGFLRALGMDSPAQPADLAGRSAEFRSRTARLKMLVVLDNAAGEDQVEPLLVAGAGCATLITSRSTLPGLQPSLRVVVPPMPDEVARHVLIAAAGADRLHTDPEAVTAIVRACAGVPLALRIAGARLAAAPQLSPAVLAGSLAGGNPLVDLSAGNKSVQASLASSFVALPEPARLALGGLARLGAPTFGPWVLGPLLDVSQREAVRLLLTVADAHLVEPGATHSGQYGLHDLVRAHARASTAPLEERTLHRLVTWALALTGLTTTNRPPLPAAVSRQWQPAELPAELVAEVTTDPPAWVAAHWPTLVAIVDIARRAGQPDAAAAVLAGFRKPMIRLDLLDTCEGAARRLLDATPADPWARAVALLTLGSVAEQRGDHPQVVALVTALADDTRLDAHTRTDALLMLGSGHHMCDATARAETALREALRIASALGDQQRQFRAHFVLAGTYRAAGDPARALSHNRRAMWLADRTADAPERAHARFALTRTLLMVGDVAAATALAAEALELVRHGGDRLGEAWCLLLQAQAACAGGDPALAARTATESIELARRLHRPDAEAAAERELARALAAGGDPAGARAAAGRAMALTTEFDSPLERRLVRDLLTELRDTSGGLVSAQSGER